MILPCSNAAETIEEALDSLFAQSFENFEVLAIDDGSEDATLPILEEAARQDRRLESSCGAWLWNRWEAIATSADEGSPFVTSSTSIRAKWASVFMELSSSPDRDVDLLRDHFVLLAVGALSRKRDEASPWMSAREEIRDRLSERGFAERRNFLSLA